MNRQFAFRRLMICDGRKITCHTTLKVRAITNVRIFVGTLPDDGEASTGAACSEIYHFESNFLTTFIDLTHENIFGLWKLV
ncbi:hypothetical protein DMH20_15765 [Escherichia coli]|nr:hypothetical protein [Escherichia coli]